MSHLFADLRLATRMLLKRPGFSLLAIVTLALGIGANTAIFSIVSASLLQPLPYPEPEELVFYHETNPTFGGMSISYLNYLDWRQRAEMVESMAVYRRDRFNLTGNGDPEQVRTTMVSANIFDTLGVAPLLGRDFTPDEDRIGGDPVVVLTWGFWQRRFGGDPGIVGQVIKLNGRGHEVIGVMPEHLQRPTRSDVYVPIGQHADLPGWDGRDNHQGIYGYGRLAEGVTLAQAQAEIDSIAAGLAETYPDTNRLNGVVYYRLSEYTVSNLRPVLLLLTAAVALVLLIACVNVANLLLARAAARERELAVRAAVGAGRWSIARQLLVESLLLSCVGGLVGILLAWSSLETLQAIYATALPGADQVVIDLDVLAFSIALMLATGVLFGLVPALQAGRLVSRLQSGFRAGSSPDRRRFQVGLATTQIALAAVLLIAAGLLLRSFDRVLNVDPGLDPENVLTARISLPQARYDSDERTLQFWEQLDTRLSALPAVREVGLTSNLPFIGGNQTSFSIAGRPEPAPGEFPSAEYARVNTGYFPAIGMRLLRGRLLEDTDHADAVPVMVIDQNFADTHWPGEDPLGKQVIFGAGGPHDEHQLAVTVVGVVATVRHEGLDVEPARPQMYFPLAQRVARDDITLVVKTEAPPETLAGPLREAVLALDPDQPVSDVQPYSEIVDDSLTDRRLSMTLFSFFAAVAVGLALVGIYGVISYGITRRTQEIGVRMAMGASGQRILMLVLRQVGVIALVGVLGGLAGATLLGRFMESQLYGVGAHDPLTFTLVPVALIAFALLACVLPARRAARTQPTEALRHE